MNDLRIDDFFDENLGGPIGGTFPIKFHHIAPELTEDPTAPGAILEFF